MHTAITRRGVNLGTVSTQGFVRDGGTTDTPCRTIDDTHHRKESSFLERTRKCASVPDARQGSIAIPLEPEMEKKLKYCAMIICAGREEFNENE
jgi:hypothetical protein